MKNRYAEVGRKCQCIIILVFAIPAIVIILCKLFESILPNWLGVGTELAVLFLIGLFVEEKHRKAREELEETSEKCTILINTAPDAIYTIDTEGNLKMWNTKLKELTGYTDEELAGMNIAKLLTPESLKIAREKIEYEVKTKKSAPPYEVSLKRKDGRIVHVEVISTPLLKDGKVVALQGFARDITERKKAEEKMRKILEEEREFKLRTAHYFFNPIVIAKGYIELAMNQLPEKERENLQKAYHAIERVEKVVKNIVTKGKIEE